MTPVKAIPACRSNSIGLRYPIVECLRFRLQKRSMSSNTSALASSRVRYVLGPVRSVLSDEKKLSIAALSTLPERLIEQITRLSAAIAAQNLISSLRPATGGRPGEGNGALPERSDRRFHRIIVAPHEALRRPLESALAAPVAVVHEPTAMEGPVGFGGPAPARRARSRHGPSG